MPGHGGGPRWRSAGRVSLALGVAAITLLAAACSSKGDDEEAPAPGASGSATVVKTGRGISGTELTLGNLNDVTGFFAASGKDLAVAYDLFWKDYNEKNGGICKTYKVTLENADSGYNVQKATTEYAAMKTKVVAMQMVLGSAIATALSEDLTADDMVAIPLAWSQSISDNPNYAIVGSTYDVEIINGLDYLLEKNLIAKGVKIGHIYHDSEYGINANAGVKYFAQQNGSEVFEQKISALQADLSSQVTALKGNGVGVIVLTGTPTQTSALATATQAQGLNVPLLGNGPTYTPELLNGDAKDVLLDRFHFSGPNGALSTVAGDQALADYRTAVGKADAIPTPAFSTGYATATVMAKILEAACAAGDLTPAGVVAAKNSLTTLDTGGMTGKLDYSKPGISPTRQSFIVKPDADADVRLEIVAELYEGPNAKTYTRAS
ncbi:ABC transporter substrate-binding protein [Frankia nepalensis]|uniref:ABC transporter substrate-binding protein n=1 Tax=Frankia nepalensis TaxID=1836974 RepID=A0A937USZ8_9ACTN|nr:ABC transporter substrate-binding protein [Frankia nepalensis]MBL7495289.1 ABC transporter substrate-binding protein [Frankia nepalensis]MBL7512324.1 ABC transporter substrate-binding protein [Frankia nepalensis]MBL7632623.1 ABC transporter substrate-binding protein [Frankia nepalensis]